MQLWAAGQAAVGGVLFAWLNRSDVPKAKGKFYCLNTLTLQTLSWKLKRSHKVMLLEEPLLSGTL